MRDNDRISRFRVSPERRQLNFCGGQEGWRGDNYDSHDRKKAILFRLNGTWKSKTGIPVALASCLL